MATSDTPDSNILDAEAVNWRLIVYPLLALFILLFGGAGLYFYLQGQREAQENAARQALLAATTPAALDEVADRYSGTTQAAIALLQAGNLAFDQKDYAAAQKNYQRAAATPDLNADVRDDAQLGLAAALDAAGSAAPAADAYLVVARQGRKSPYAPYAYDAAAQVDEQRNDKDAERRVLTEAASLGGDSAFTKQAQAKLHSLEAAR
jgi:hypothetical protein